MHYNKKRTKTVTLFGVILLLGVCGCNTEASVQEEQNRGSVAGTVTEAAVQEGAKITETVTQEPAEIIQAVTEEEEGTTGAVKPTVAVEEEPGDMEDTEEEKHVDTGEEEPADKDGAGGVGASCTYKCRGRAFYRRRGGVDRT